MRGGIRANAKGRLTMRELFEANPELFDIVKKLVENTHNFLYDSQGGGDYNIEVWNECIPAILEKAREFPALQEWAAQLDAFEEAESA
jgi:hypothetical protein